MMNDIKAGKISVELRNNADVDEILKRRYYQWKVSFMKVNNYLDYYFKYFLFQASRVKNIPGKIKRNFSKSSEPISNGRGK
jgi:hypothetical protein